MNDYTECAVCGEPFTEHEWNNRHWLKSDPGGEYHERCCTGCDEDEVYEEEEDEEEEEVRH